MTKARVIVCAVPWGDPRAALLREAQQAELRTLYQGDAEPGVKPTAADVPVFFLLVGEDGTALGCGGLRPLDAETGEIKRMFVRPEQRGQGLAGRLLIALEGEARRLGWRRLRLETGTLQHAAMALYARHAYRPIPAFGAYIGSPTSRCYEKDLLIHD